MDRRSFLKYTLAAGGTALVSQAFPESVVAARKAAVNLSSGKFLNAFYYRAHMYTMVPKHIREDLKWMADAGTDAVTIAILEQDFDAAFENVEFICNEAAKLGMSVIAVPSRWGGIVAGSPKVPSVFTTQNPQTWVLRKDGTPVNTPVTGRISSIHYEETYEFVLRSLDKLYKSWDIKGIIWDELKTLKVDYSLKALEKMGPNPTEAQQLQANVDFYSRINKYLKTHYPDKTTSMFIYSDLSDEIVDKMAETQYLDYYGCDGRPWRVEDGGKAENPGKMLVGHVGQRFIDAAKARNKKSLFLIENHNMANADIPLLEKRMPELMQMDIDQLIYYYYPRNIEDPDRLMAIMKRELKSFKK